MGVNTFPTKVPVYFSSFQYSEIIAVKHNFLLREILGRNLNEAISLAEIDFTYFIHSLFHFMVNLLLRKIFR